MHAMDCIWSQLMHACCEVILYLMIDAIIRASLMHAAESVYRTSLTNATEFIEST